MPRCAHPANRVGLCAVIGSLWFEDVTRPQAAALEHDVSVDVAVLGAGIVGLTTALLLERQGARVAVLEGRRVAAGASGYNTAKLSSLHGLSYRKLVGSLGADAARAYGEANEAGIARVFELAGELEHRLRPAAQAELHLHRVGVRSRSGARGGGGGARARASGVVCRGRRPAVPGGGRRALRRAGGVPPGEVPGRARRGTRRVGVRGHDGHERARRARAHGRRPGGERRARRGGHAPALPRPRALLRPLPPGALVRRGRPDDRCARGHVPLDRAARSFDQGARRLAACGRGEPQDGPGRRRGALRAARGVGARALRDRARAALGHSGPHACGRRALRGAPRPALVRRLGGHRLPQVGSRHGHGRGGAARRPDRRHANTPGPSSSTRSACGRGRAPARSCRRTRTWRSASSATA